jgi:formate dehydrogenase subunit gamma
MTKLIASLRFALGAALLAVIVLGAPAGAQQPASIPNITTPPQTNPDGSPNPTASSVKEQELLRQMQIIRGRGTLPDTKSYTIEQPPGRDWQMFHETTLRWIGAIAILGMLLLLVAFYLIRGMVRIEAGRSGRVIVRFSQFERFVHWMAAGCFIVLGITGLNFSYGKPLLLPLIGPDAFSTWSQWAKYAHDYVSFPFTLTVVLIFLMWLAWNVPSRIDIEWIKEGGGLVGHKHPPADRMNAGQKAIYWFVVLAGGTIAASGYLLMFPFYVTDVTGQQWAEIVHGVVALLFVAVMLAHIYIGTIGMEGAFEGMWEGTVDVNWAKEHHSIWYEREVAKGNVETPPPRGRMAPAE